LKNAAARYRLTSHRIDQALPENGHSQKRLEGQLFNECIKQTFSHPGPVGSNGPLLQQRQASPAGPSNASAYARYRGRRVRLALRFIEAQPLGVNKRPYNPEVCLDPSRCQLSCWIAGWVDY
jgi:hypothetical protein